MSEKENLTDSEIAERMLKLFDGGVHWGRGSAYREARENRYGTYPEQWCLIGAYRHVQYGHQQVSLREMDATRFVQTLAMHLVRMYGEKNFERWGLTPFITSINDYRVESYEEIRQILEEVRDASEQAERDGNREGTAAD